MGDITVVIGNFQGEAVLGDCLASLAGQTTPPTAAIVVDGSSTDGSVAVAGSFGVPTVVVENRGLGALYNRGAQEAATEYVLFANNDVALEPDCLNLLGAALDADPSRFAADARQVDWTGSHVVHAHTTLRRGGLLREYIPGLRLDHLAEAGDVRPTVCANGAAMLVRRHMALELGGFDETFFMEWEDLDLCWRAWLREWATVYVPQAVVRHRVGAVTTRAVLPRRLASSHHNLVRFALKCLPPRAAARVVAGELLRLPRHPYVVSRGLAAVARELPQIARLRRRIRPRPALLAWMLQGQPE
jgi:GT2 family glycosyltransferase